MVLASLALALFWGAAHALSPGHGKTIVTAYLVGQRGTPRHAALLGLIVTATHTIGVFALGLVTLALSQFIVPDQLYPWLNLASGLLVVAIGASVLAARWRRTRARPRRHGHDHHAHHHHHEHARDGRPSFRSLLAVGVSGGLLPCPSALVVLLAAISLHRVAFGLLLIVAFSAGLALAITGIGLVAVLAKRAFARASFDGAVLRALPAPSARSVILVAGVAMTSRHALPKVTLMFGLDDRIASFSDGTTMLVVIVVAFVLGLRHASDPDHLAAVTTLIASGKERAARSAARLGLIWGLGHATSLFAFGVPIVLYRAYLPERCSGTRRRPSAS